MDGFKSLISPHARRQPRHPRHYVARCGTEQAGKEDAHEKLYSGSEVSKTEGGCSATRCDEGSGVAQADDFQLCPGEARRPQLELHREPDRVILASR
ncbi:hypothetical protein E2C01_012840 [Portunus trituberculatus]|uniref:Uncharacterized protein n=1 Tax=Portunus trituberculatus TaxID=210409 RepID=A0A5B7DFH8_PORTR|nr:hypothetical protein [Portunus trituberculatus]